MKEITIVQNEDEEGPFVYTRRTQYYETDQMGIINNTNYIRWFEEARMAYLDRYGFGYADLEKRGILIPVLSVGCTFKKPVRFEETVDIEVTLSGFKGVRFTVNYKVKEHESGELRSEGTSTHCFLDSEMHPVRIKKTAPDVYDFFISHMEEMSDD